MKKKIIAVLLCASAIMSLTACGGKTDSTEIVKEAGASKEKGTSNSKTSADFEIDYEKQVVELCDYSAIPVELPASYEVTDAAINEYFTQLVLTYGGNPYHEITDRTEVKDGDYVNVDYKGIKDGEAFQGGTATNQLIDVTGNCSVDGTGYIEGFTSGIIGAKVGDTIDCDVTFPENYGNADLAGAAVVFQFTINGIYDNNAMTIDEVNDKFVDDLFGAVAGLSTVDQLKDGMKKDLESKKKNAATDSIMDYILSNSTIEVPEDYLDVRLEEFVSYYKSQNITDGSTLDEFMQSNYGVSEEEALDGWKESITNQIKQEIVLGYIAQLEDIKVDDAQYAEYINNYVMYNNMTSEDQLFEHAGNGNIEVGKKFLSNKFKESLAVDKIAETASITFVNDED